LWSPWHISGWGLRDEFGLILDGGPDDTEVLCRRLASTVQAPHILAGRPYPVHASLGLVIADPTSGPVTADTLLREADTAMYTAKQQGKGGLVTHRRDLSAPDPASQAPDNLTRAPRGEPGDTFT
jgi:predicted signal transduction protein with EAL and GGDEF domain